MNLSVDEGRSDMGSKREEKLHCLARSLIKQTVLQRRVGTTWAPAAVAAQDAFPAAVSISSVLSCLYFRNHNSHFAKRCLRSSLLNQAFIINTFAVTISCYIFGFRKPFYKQIDGFLQSTAT